MGWLRRSLPDQRRRPLRVRPRADDDGHEQERDQLREAQRRKQRTQTRGRRRPCKRAGSMRPRTAPRTVGKKDPSALATIKISLQTAAEGGAQPAY